MPPWQWISELCSGDPERVEGMLAQLDLHARDAEGLAPAERAVDERDAGLLQLLLDRGARLDPGLRLAAAILCGDLARVDWLVRSEDVNRFDQFRRTPLMYAVETDREAIPEIVERLLQRGADPSVVGPYSLGILGRAAEKGDPRVVAALLRGGADPNGPHDSFATPLLALFAGWPETLAPDRIACVRLLLAAGARLYSREDDPPWSALTRMARELAPWGDHRSEPWCVLESLVRCVAPPADQLAVLALLLAADTTLIAARGGPALLTAVACNDLPFLDALLTAGAPLDARDDEGRGPVVLAVQRGHADVLAHLLRRGAAVPATDPRGRSLLLQARAAEDPRIAALIGPHVSPVHYAVTPAGLADAIAAGDLEGALWILDAGVDADAEFPDGDLPLVLAARLGHVEILRTLVARGAAVDRRSNIHYCEPTAVGEAADRGHVECVRALIEFGCDFNCAASFPPLYQALRHGSGDPRRAEVVRLLLAAGADPAGTGLEMEPLTATWDPAMIDLLVAAFRTPAQRRTALKSAIRHAVYRDDLDKLRELLRCGPDLYDEPDDTFDERPLDIAARQDIDTLRFLLACGPCTLDRKGPQNRDMPTPLMSAASGGAADAVQVLLDAGADVRARDADGFTPLIHACTRQHEQTASVIDLLLARGAELETRTKDGQTAVMLAAERGAYGAVEALLRHGADLSLRDHHGRSVLALARASGVPQLLALLASHRR